MSTDVKVKMIGGNCGCVFCKSGHAPSSRDGWRGQRNKYGKSYGMGKSAVKK